MSGRASSPADIWSFAGHRRRQARRGLELSPAERLRWLEVTVHEMRSLLGRAADGRDSRSGPQAGDPLSER